MIADEPCEQGTGSSKCWHCGRQFQRATGVGKGLFYFRRVQDKDGVIHRVHSDCVKNATSDGWAKLIASEAP